MSLFICPTHGLHHGPFCCDEPQTWWDGEFDPRMPAQVGDVKQAPSRSDESGGGEANRTKDSAHD